VTTTLKADSPDRSDGTSRVRRRGRGRMKLSGPLAFVLLSFLVLYPLAMVLVASFINGTPLPGTGTDLTPRLGNFAGLWSTATARALTNSLIAGVSGTILAVAVGGIIAWLTARTDVPFRGLVSVAGIIPLFIPSLVGATAWSFLSAPQTGYLSLAMQSLGINWQFNIYSLKGLVFVFALYNVPYAFIFINNTLNLVNSELEEAAAVHGASKLQTVIRTTIPLVKPAILNAGLLTFVLILQDFPVSMVLGYSAGIQTLSSRVYILMFQAPPAVNAASALGVVLMIFTLLIVTLQYRLLRRQSFATVTGKGLRISPLELGPFRWVGFAFVMIYMFVAVVLPIGALIIGALRTSLYTPSFGSLFDTASMSFNALKSNLTEPTAFAAAANTIIVGIITAVLGTTLCFFLAHYAHRSSSRMGRLIGQLTILPAAVPGVVLGLGMLWAYTAIPILLYGTLGILVLAFVTQFLPQGVGNMSGAIGRIHQDLEESASVSGATKLRVVTWVTLPLVKSAAASTGLMLFILAMRELSAAIFLYTPKTQLLSIYLFNLYENGRFSAVASISLAYSGLLLVLVIAGRKWLNNV